MMLTMIINDFFPFFVSLYFMIEMQKKSWRKKKLIHHTFPKGLSKKWNKALSRIWTPATSSIFYDNDHYSYVYMDTIISTRIFTLNVCGRL